jgi:hypothetical protein
MSFFTAAQTAAMRDPTKRRNYSVEAEEFRREHAARRVWGLQQRHARKMRSLHGSTSAAWADYQQRIEELQSPVCAAPADDEAGPPARAGFDSTTGTASATPGPALPQTAPPETAPPETAPPETAPPVATTSAQVQDIPVVCDASTSEVLIPEAILAETATTEPTAGRGQISPAPAHPRAPHRSRPSSPRSNRYPRGGQREHRQPPAHKMTTVRHGAAPPRPASRNPADKRPPPDPTGNPRTDEARQQGRRRRKQTPSTRRREAEAGQQQLNRIRMETTGSIEFFSGAGKFLPTRNIVADTKPETTQRIAFPGRASTIIGRCACGAWAGRCEVTI